MSRIALISLYGVENNGIRLISSLLKTHGFNTHLIFFKRWLNNDIHFPNEKEKHILISLFRDLHIDLVGISFTSPFFKIAQDLTLRIKKALPIVVVWGGVHATVAPERCLDYCDLVCRGEGEYAMLDIAKAMNAESSFNGIKNICYKKNGKVIFEEMRPLLKNLDTLPYQDYGGSDKFFIERKLVQVDPLENAAELRIFASRGCPFNCSYCYNSIFRRLYRDSGYHRIRKVDIVISEIEYALRTFKRIRKIKFDDDTFVFPRHWLAEFCRKYRTRIKLPFEALFNAECLDKESLQWLKDAGLRRAQVGIQTISEKESRQIFNRNLSLESIRQFALVSKKLGLDIVYDIILDNPLSAQEDKEALVHFLLSLPRPFNLFLYSLTVFPGTELSEIFIGRGLIKSKDIEGEAHKSFYQFRFSFSYPHDRNELFMACIISLTSKSFLPKSFIFSLMENRFLRKYPSLLRWFAEFCNFTKLAGIFLRMVRKGEVNTWKLKEYGSYRRFLIQ